MNQTRAENTINLQKVDNFIGNEFQRPLKGDYLERMNPSTGKPLFKVSNSRAEDVQTALSSAKSALPYWSGLHVSERCSYLARVADLLQERIRILAMVECEDTGKPLKLCLDLDLPRAVANFRFFSELAKNQHSSFYETKTAHSYVLKVPLGVVGLIVPWNLPIYLLSWKLAPALAMGNTVVIKPSELTPRTANLLAEIFVESGLPSGVVNIVHGEGTIVGEAIVTSEIVSGISFTGGTQTGQRVASLASTQLKKLSLELGGKNSILVFEDADLKPAAKAVARSIFLNQGQICLCSERVLIQRNIYKDFVQMLLEEKGQLKIGDPIDMDTNYGAIISEAHLKKIESVIDLAKKEGARFLCGGHRITGRGGFYFEPTLIEGLSSKSTIAQKEVFGPVATLHPFDSEEEAISICNDVVYGLSASCWTQNLHRGQRLAAQIQCGTIWINTWLNRDLRVPFGGMKMSGLGREGGELSLDFFSETKTVSTLRESI